MNTMPIEWVIEHQPMFISALMFVMMDLTNEVMCNSSTVFKETFTYKIFICGAILIFVKCMKNNEFKIIVLIF